MKTVKSKFCWVATETKKGYRLKLAIGNKDYRLSGLLLEAEKDVNRILTKGGIVFIHLKDK